MASCHKDPVSGPSEAVVHINASLVGAEAVTRLPIDGTSFPDYYEGYNRDNGNGSYGIFVCQHGTTDKAHAHKSNSYNLMARFSSGNWSYLYVSNLSTGAVATTGTNNLTITQRDGNITADLYAYAPYIQNAYSAGPTAIPYSIANVSYRQADLMYAVENLSTYEDDTEYQDGNENLNPLSPTLNASFHFKHAFALLAFNFKLMNDASTGAYGTGTSYSLSNITVTLNGETTTAKLYRSGTFNAITGTFNTGGEDVTSLSVNLSNVIPIISSASSDVTTYLMLVPTDVADNELVFTFTVNGQTLRPFYLKASHLTRYEDDTHTTPVPGTEGKLVGGYKYTFNFTLDNYLFLDGFSVGEWTTPVSPLGEQEI